MAVYVCKYCSKKVYDRHPYYEELCDFSPTKKHEFVKQGGDISNDTKWSESFVGIYWKWIVAAIIIYYILDEYIL